MHIGANVEIGKLFALVLCLCASPLSAQGLWPAFYDVSGVANDDVLNVRSLPDATSERIGTLSHDQKNVEVAFTSDDGNWGAVNVGEQAGWVRLSFLERQPGNWTDADQVFSQCFGTEPFWSLSYDETDNRVLVLKTLEETQSFNLHRDRYVSANRTDRLTLVTGIRTSFGGDFFMLRSEACSDGMSDRSLGIGLDVIYRSEDGLQMLSGCCSLN